MATIGENKTLSQQIAEYIKKGILGANVVTATDQSKRRRAGWQVIFNGQDITNRLDPYLISVNVIERTNGINEAHIELDDRDGKLALPRFGVGGFGGSVLIRIGWASSGPRPLSGGSSTLSFQPKARYLAFPDPSNELELGWDDGGGVFVVFQGEISNLESGFSRTGGGRRLWVDCTGTSLDTIMKQINHDSLGEGEAVSGSIAQKSLKEWAEHTGGKAGVKFFVSPELSTLMRPFWGMSGESFWHHWNNMGHQLGADFSITNNNASLIPYNSMTDVFGNSLNAIIAEWGVNLISWRIKPYSTRALWKGADISYFDVAEGKWMRSIQNAITSAGSTFGFDSARALASLPNAAPNKAIAGQIGSGRVDEAKMGAGAGWATINGEPRARAKGRLVIIGARDGVDGSYEMTEVQHTYIRAGNGFTTRATTRDPQATN